MKRSRIAVATMMSLAWLAACEAPMKETAPDVSASLDRSSGQANGQNAQGEDEDSPGNRHEHGLIGAVESRAVQKARPGSGTGISFHGGTTLSSINIQAIYWAAAPIYKNGPAAGTNGAASNDGSLVGYFLSNVGGSPYYNINTTYTNASGAKLLNSVNYVSYWANNTNVPSNGQNVGTTAIMAMLQSGFDGNKLTYDANTLYTVFTAGTVNLGGGAGTQYCAYHTNGNVIIGGVSKRIYYAVMPYNAGWPSGCMAGLASPNADAPADAEVNTLVHEIEETQTDAMGNAWYDNRGYENADKCAWTFGTTFNNGVGVYNTTIGTKNFLVQQNWINSGSGGCRISW